MSNIKEFRNYLNKYNVVLEELEDEKSYVFRGVERLKQGGKDVTFIISFDKSSNDVSLLIFDIADITSSSKPNEAYKLANELNSRYRFSKIIIETNSFDRSLVNLHQTLLFNDNFDPNVILDALSLSLGIADKTYAEFMKLIWS